MSIRPNQAIGIAAAAVVLVVTAAGASAYFTQRAVTGNNVAAPTETAVTATAPAPEPHPVHTHYDERHAAARRDDIHWNDNRAASNAAQVQPAAAAQPAVPTCNDHNIVGLAAGGLAGGLIGNQFGKGSGKTIATVGGAVGGAALGNQYIPTQNVLCK